MKRQASVSSLTTIHQRLKEDNRGLRTSFLRSSSSFRMGETSQTNLLSQVELESLSSRGHLSSLSLRSSSDTGGGGIEDNGLPKQQEARIYENPLEDSSTSEEEEESSKNLDTLRQRKLAFVSTGVVGLSRYHRYKDVAPYVEPTHQHISARRRMRMHKSASRTSQASQGEEQQKRKMEEELANSKAGIIICHKDISAIEKGKEYETRHHPRQQRPLTARKVVKKDVPVEEQLAPKPIVPKTLMGPKTRNRMTKGEQERVNERLSQQKAHKRKVQDDNRRARGLEPAQETKRRQKVENGSVVSGTRKTKKPTREGKIEIFRLEGHSSSTATREDIPDAMRAYLMGAFDKPAVKNKSRRRKSPDHHSNAVDGLLEQQRRDEGNGGGLEFEVGTRVLHASEEPAGGDRDRRDTRDTDSLSDSSMDSTDLNMAVPSDVSPQRRPMVGSTDIPKTSAALLLLQRHSEPSPSMPPGSPRSPRSPLVTAETPTSLPDTTVEHLPVETPGVIRAMRPRNRANTDLLGVAQTLALFKALKASGASPLATTVVEEGEESSDDQQEKEPSRDEQPQTGVISTTGSGWAKIRKSIRSTKKRGLREEVLDFIKLRRETMGSKRDLLRDDDLRSPRARPKPSYDPAYILGDVAAASQAIQDADRRKLAKESHRAMEAPLPLLSDKFRRVHKTMSLNDFGPSPPASPGTSRGKLVDPTGGQIAGQDAKSIKRRTSTSMLGLDSPVSGRSPASSVG